MKKKKLGMILIGMSCCSLLACSNTKTSIQSTTAENTQVTEIDQTLQKTEIATETSEPTEKPIPTEAPKMVTYSIEEFDNLMKDMPVSIESTKYTVQDDKYKSLYPDMLQVIIKNNTDSDIKDAVIAFVAWEKNNLPVKIEGQYDFRGFLS